MLNIHDNCEKLTLGSFDKIELAAGVYAKVAFIHCKHLLTLILASGTNPHCPLVFSHQCVK
jgi:hypothetical protein